MKVLRRRIRLRTTDTNTSTFFLHVNSLPQDFYEELINKNNILFLRFLSADEIIVKMHGSQLTQRYLEKHGFDVPIMVPKLDDLGLRLPSPAFSVMDVERYVGTKLVPLSTCKNMVKL